MHTFNFDKLDDVDRVGSRTGEILIKRKSQVPKNPISGQPRVSQYPIKNFSTELLQSYQFSETTPGIQFIQDTQLSNEKLMISIMKKMNFPSLLWSSKRIWRGFKLMIFQMVNLIKFQTSQIKILSSLIFQFEQFLIKEQPNKQKTEKHQNHSPVRQSSQPRQQVSYNTTRMAESDLLNLLMSQKKLFQTPNQSKYDHQKYLELQNMVYSGQAWSEISNNNKNIFVSDEFSRIIQNDQSKEKSKNFQQQINQSNQVNQNLNVFLINPSNNQQNNNQNQQNPFSQEIKQHQQPKQNTNKKKKQFRFNIVEKKHQDDTRIINQKFEDNQQDQLVQKKDLNSDQIQNNIPQDQNQQKNQQVKNQDKRKKKKKNKQSSENQFQKQEKDQNDSPKKNSHQMIQSILYFDDQPNSIQQNQENKIDQIQEQLAPDFIESNMISSKQQVPKYTKINQDYSKDKFDENLPQVKSNENIQEIFQEQNDQIQIDSKEKIIQSNQQSNKNDKEIIQSQQMQNKKKQKKQKNKKNQEQAISNSKNQNSENPNTETQFQSQPKFQIKQGYSIKINDMIIPLDNKFIKFSKEYKIPIQSRKQIIFRDKGDNIQIPNIENFEFFSVLHLQDLKQLQENKRYPSRNRGIEAQIDFLKEIALFFENHLFLGLYKPKESYVRQVRKLALFQQQNPLSTNSIKNEFQKKKKIPKNYQSPLDDLKFDFTEEIINEDEDYQNIKIIVQPKSKKPMRLNYEGDLLIEIQSCEPKKITIKNGNKMLQYLNKGAITTVDYQETYEILNFSETQEALFHCKRFK